MKTKQLVLLFGLFSMPILAMEIESIVQNSNHEETLPQQLKEVRRKKKAGKVCGSQARGLLGASFL